MTLMALPLFGELERIAADLYPYRWPISVLLVAAGVAAVVLALRLGIHERLWQHRLLTAVVGVPLLVLAVAIGEYTLSPLWERSFLEEASPVEAAPGGAMTTAAGGPAASQATSEARLQRRGQFMGADSFHFARGDALLIEAEPGRYVVRFEDFSVRNGPDLYVYLSSGPTSRVDEALNLGRLKATDGAFNYEVPAEIDVSGVTSVLVWCRQFGVLFGSARLMTV